MGEARIRRMFDTVREQKRPGLIVFLTAGFPDMEATLELVPALVAAGADAVELGVPFSDPLAEGPVIQESSFRALQNGTSLGDCLNAAAVLRDEMPETPLILMGYYNPIYILGVDAFAAEAQAAGVDGLIIVDLPPEEVDELWQPARAAGIDFIFLTAPTSDDARLPVIVKRASGFIYYVSITGITGTRSADIADVGVALKRICKHTELPIAVGFGIKTPEQAAEIASVADAAVVGSALVDIIAANLDPDGRPKEGVVEKLLGLVADLSAGIGGADKKVA